jgi:hypothetical protein
LFSGEILTETVPDIAVSALEVASVRHLEFEISERRNGRWVNG